MNELHIIVTRAMARHVVHQHDRGALETSMLRNAPVQLNIPIAGCAWQSRDALVACDARGVERLLK